MWLEVFQVIDKVEPVKVEWKLVVETEAKVYNRPSRAFFTSEKQFPFICPTPFYTYTHKVTNLSHMPPAPIPLFTKFSVIHGSSGPQHRSSYIYLVMKMNTHPACYNNFKQKWWVIKTAFTDFGELSLACSTHVGTAW